MPRPCAASALHTLEGHQTRDLKEGHFSSPPSDKLHALRRPDNRAWRPFPALSGGQQALATLALSFALQAAYPSPLYFFDEIDCMLDSTTAARVADYIRSQACSQYIVVSHKPQVQVLPNMRASAMHSWDQKTCWRLHG